MNEPTFRIGPYPKRELARLYFPFTENTDTAVTNLRKLMKRNPELMSELAAARYKPHAKVLTPRQVKIIVHFLGKP